jgi:monoamine oxidase
VAILPLKEGEQMITSADVLVAGADLAGLTAARAV